MIWKKMVICLNYGHYEEQNWGQWLYHKITISTKSVMSNPLQPLFTIWNSRSPCGAESVSERRSFHCWTSWLALDKENRWRSTPAVAPDGWVQWALHNPSICCCQSPLDGEAQNDLGIKSSQAVTHPTVCGAKPCLTSMITWQALYPRPYSFSL